MSQKSAPLPAVVGMMVSREGHLLFLFAEGVQSMQEERNLEKVDVKGVFGLEL